MFSSHRIANSTLERKKADDSISEITWGNIKDIMKIAHIVFAMVYIISLIFEMYTNMTKLLKVNKRKEGITVAHPGPNKTFSNNVCAYEIM